MKKVTISVIRGTLRYRAVSIEEDGYYIVDLDSSLLTVLFPFLSPFMMKKYFAISEQQFHTISSAPPSQKYSFGTLLSFGIFGSIISRLLPNNFLVISDTILKIVFLLLTLAIVIAIRLRLSSTPDFLVDVLDTSKSRRLKLRYTDMKLLAIYFIVILCTTGVLLLMNSIFAEQATTLIDYLLWGSLTFGYLFSSLLFNNHGNYMLKSDIKEIMK